MHLHFDPQAFPAIWNMKLPLMSLIHYVDLFQMNGFF